MKVDTSRKLKKIKSERGSLSVESSIGVLVFVVAMFGLLTFISQLAFAEKVHQAIYETAEVVSTVDVENSLECYAVATAVLATKIDLKEALSNKLLLYQTPLEEDGSFTLKVLWHKKIPMGGNLIQHYELKSRLITRGSDGKKAEADETVYVTNTGTKYHLSGCIHLRSSSWPISRSEAIEKKYEPCLNCVGGLNLFEKGSGKKEED